MQLHLRGLKDLYYIDFSIKSENVKIVLSSFMSMQYFLRIYYDYCQVPK